MSRRRSRLSSWRRGAIDIVKAKIQDTQQKVAHEVIDNFKMKIQVENLEDDAVNSVKAKIQAAKLVEEAIVIDNFKMKIQDGNLEYDAVNNVKAKIQAAELGEEDFDETEEELELEEDGVTHSEEFEKIMQELEAEAARRRTKEKAATAKLS